MSDTTIDDWFIWVEANKDVGTRDWAENILPKAKSALYDLILKEVVGETIPLNAHIDDELLRYVPDMKERSLEVTGVSSAFTTLYTRALVQQVQQEMRNKLKELFDE